MRIASATVSAASTAITMFSASTGTPATRLPSSSHDGADEPTVEEPDRAERRDAEREHDPEVGPGDGENRPEEVLEEIDVECPGARDQHDTEGETDVEDESERLIAGCPGPGAQELDGDGTDDGEAEGHGDRRHVEEHARGNPGERDMAETVADQRLPTLDEEEADGRRQHAHDGADGKGEAHELEVQHQCPCVWSWDGSCQIAGSSPGGPSNTIPPRTRTRRSTTCSTAPNSCET